METVKADHVTMIAVNRPEVRNCVDAETATQLYDAFQEFERDENAHVAVFYGKGRPGHVAGANASPGGNDLRISLKLSSWVEMTLSSFHKHGSRPFYFL